MTTPTCILPLCDKPRAYGTNLCVHHHNDQSMEAFQAQIEPLKRKEGFAENLGLAVVIATLAFLLVVLVSLGYKIVTWAF